MRFKSAAAPATVSGECFEITTEAYALGRFKMRSIRKPGDLPRYHPFDTRGAYMKRQSAAVLVCGGVPSKLLTYGFRA